MRTTKMLLFLGAWSLASVNSMAEEHIAKAIDGATNGQHRSMENRARDTYRHPKETLLFFGLEPHMKVLEILPGRGWYTEILAPVVQPPGVLTVASFGAQHPSDYLRGIHVEFIKHIDSQPEIYRDVKRVLFEGEGYLGDVESGSQDIVLTFRNTHNWIRYGGIEEIYQAFYRVLKNGGILGVVQHRAEKGSDASQTAVQGYVPESHLIRLIEGIGFELVDKSEVNANPKDSKDHPEGVWSLPPAYRLGEQDKEKYTAIGESDRMTLKFIKLRR